MASEWQQLELDPIVRDAEPKRTAPSRPAPAPAAPRRDPAAMTATELLVAILGPSHVPVCAELAATYATFRTLAKVHPADLRDHGLTPGTIDKLGAVFEIARRYGEEEFAPGQPFRGSHDIYAHFRERLANETVEHFIAVLLDNKHRKMRDITVALGSLTSTVVHPRDVFSRIIRDAAAAVIFVHNHPSGDPTPSREDLEITRRLREVGEIVGVRILDHVIIGAGRYVSFVDDGYW
jgi:DNA repair protein RadC